MFASSLTSARIGHARSCSTSQSTKYGPKRDCSRLTHPHRNQKRPKNQKTSSSSSSSSSSREGEQSQSKAHRLDEKVALFGISHAEKEYEAAEFIIKNRPKYVLCETAVSKQHGEKYMNTCTFEQGVTQMMIDPGLDEALTFVTRLAGNLKSEVERDPLKGDFWMSMREQLPAEPMVYAAAMYVDAKVVFADRPKKATYGRLVTEPSLVQLDEAFSKQSERNYRLLMPDGDKLRIGLEDGTILNTSATTTDAFQKYIIDERDQIMTTSIRKCLSDLGADAKENSIVCVVGADHFEGIKKCYKDVFGASEVEAKVAEMLECKSISSVDSPGLRLAIALRMLGLRCSPDLIEDIMRSLEKDVASLDSIEAEKFELNSEAFGSTRMLLALVDDREVFDATVAGVGKSDFWEKLAKFRNMRLKHGGCGIDSESINDLRLASMVLGFNN